MPWIIMAAIAAKKLKKIRLIENEVEPYIINMIKGSDESNCPYKTWKEGNLESNETKEVLAKVARMLYRHDLLSKMSISLSDETAYDTLFYAFGYWGMRTLYKHHNEICLCENKCFDPLQRSFVSNE
ncbi:MAG: hypothetical protein JSV56_09050 [Methanomassiliicoccales archaeon]|nr:MAG: hypothetical protein JSV56_09050 [Methanomassiliicoccales archaeon]